MGFPSYKYLLFLVLACSYVFIKPANSMSSPSCHDHERSALLQFKQSFLIDCSFSPFLSAYPKVNSWTSKAINGGDCCLWDGVECDEVTGHVTGLDLTNSCLYGTFPLNSTVFSLVHLQVLKLAHNEFNYSRIPSQVGQLSKLRILDLSDSGFSGQIPSEISNLSQLSLLNLSRNGNNQLDLKLEDPNMGKLVRNLTRLKILDLNAVDISSPLPNILSNLTSLTYISLELCNLYGELPKTLFHLPHLEFLLLAANPNLVGFLHEFQGNLPLRKLQISFTSISGELPPSIGKLAHLENLLLGDCGFSGLIPDSLGNLTNLNSLDLFDNDFRGDIPFSITNLTQLQVLGLSHLNVSPEKLTSWLFRLNKLTWLRISDMNLGAENPSFLANLTSLKILNLRRNQLTGQIPHWLMNLTQLERLLLQGNQLEGSISRVIPQLTNLEVLFLDGNAGLYGNFDALSKLKYLKDVQLSGVNLTFSGSNTANQSLPKFYYLHLDSCNLIEFPSFLHNQDELQDLNLGHNRIHGLIPQWFVNLTRESLYSLDISNNFLTGFEHSPVVIPWTHLKLLNLQNNQLQGSLPIPLNPMLIYKVSNNLLSGVIPRQICDASYLKFLDISNNNMGGQIPGCIGDLGDSLLVLNLRGNNFHGPIPHNYPESCKLEMINLSQNQLAGNVPRSLANCTMLEVLDIGNNRVKDTFPSWMSSLSKLQVLVLRNNNFHGKIGRPKSSFDFHSLRIIDLSHNFHDGDLPLEYLKNWSAMKLVDEGQSSATRTEIYLIIRLPNLNMLLSEGYNYSITITNKGNEMLYSRILTVLRVIDFSSNNFTGRIPSSIGELEGLQALNLSNNNLEGRIPSSLANIRDIQSLDLSNNMLSGEIPQELAQLTSLEVFNVSDNGLVGPIPQGRQFNTFDNSSFYGNLALCGSPLSKKCENAYKQPPPPPPLVMSNEKEDDSNLIDWVIRSLGYVSGFIVGCVLGKYITDHNHGWFMRAFGRRRTRMRRAPRRRS